MLFGILVAVIVLMVLTFCYKIQKHKHYWDERGIPNTGFKFFWGDDTVFFTKKESMHSFFWEEYKSFPGVGFYGRWTMFGLPTLMLRNDFDLIKSIWIKDFDHFAIANSASKKNRSIWPSSREEKLMLNHIQNVHGDEWKTVR